MQNIIQPLATLSIAFVFAIGLLLAGCTAGSLTGPETISESPEVVTVTPTGPSGERNEPLLGDDNGGGSTTHGPSRNEVPEEEDEEE